MRLTIPTIPRAVLRIFSAINEGEATFKIVPLVAQDPGLSADVMRLASSAHFGRSAASSLQNAVVRIGTANLLLLAASALGRAALGDKPSEEVQRIWEDCMIRSRLAQGLAQMVEPQSASIAQLVVLMRGAARMAAPTGDRSIDPSILRKVANRARLQGELRQLHMGSESPASQRTTLEHLIVVADELPLADSEDESTEVITYCNRHLDIKPELLLDILGQVLATAAREEAMPAEARINVDDNNAYEVLQQLIEKMGLTSDWLASANVVVVDCSRTKSGSVVRALNKLGAQGIRVYLDPKEARDALAAEPADLVFTSWILIDSTAQEFLDSLQDDPKRAVIVSSSPHVPQARINTGELSSEVQVLQFPFKLDDLEKTLV